MLQRTPEWYEMRRGRFTASDITRILGKEGLKMTKQSIDNICLEKAIESVFGCDDSGYTSFDMQRAIELEPLAFDFFKELKSLEFINVENCGFFEFFKDSGASPDGIVSDNSVLEIKCPIRKTFFELKMTGDILTKYKDQMQMQMLCTNTEKAYFFNYIIINGEEYHHEIIVNRDEKRIDLIKERLFIAVERRNQIIKQIQ